MATDSSANDAIQRLSRRAKRLFAEIEDAGYVVSSVTGGGQPHAVLHPEDVSLERDSKYKQKSGVIDLGPTGVGEMIAL